MKAKITLAKEFKIGEIDKRITAHLLSISVVPFMAEYMNLSTRQRMRTALEVTL